MPHPDASCSIYDMHNIHTLRAKTIRNLSPEQLDYISAIIKEGINYYVENIPSNVNYCLAVYDGWALPFSVSTQEVNALMASPKACYFLYPVLLEGSDYGRKRAPIAKALLKLLTPFARFEKLILVNNWFVTNNPTPDLSPEALNEIRQTLIKKYPGHVFIIKSIPEADPTDLVPTLRAQGYNLINWRLCHYWRPSGPMKSKRTKQFRVDQKLLDKTNLDKSYIETMDEADSKTCEHLFQKLYIDKYTSMNMKMTSQWFLLARNTGMFDYFVIRQEKQIKAFAMTYQDALGINAGYVGYDLNDGQALGLYRIVFASTLRKGIEEDRLVNLSTGVARFKTLRGTKPSGEFEAVYTSHLSPITHMLMRIFIWGFNRFGENIRCR